MPEGQLGNYSSVTITSIINYRENGVQVQFLVVLPRLPFLSCLLNECNYSVAPLCYNNSLFLK